MTDRRAAGLRLAAVVPAVLVLAAVGFVALAGVADSDTSITVTQGDFTLTCPAGTVAEGETLACTLANTSAQAQPWPVVAILHLSSDEDRVLVRGSLIDAAFGARSPGADLDGGVEWIGETLVGYSRFDWPGKAGADPSTTTTTAPAAHTRTVRIVANDDALKEGSERFYVALGPDGSRGVGLLYNNRQKVTVTEDDAESSNNELSSLKLTAAQQDHTLLVTGAAQSVTVAYGVTEATLTAEGAHLRASMTVSASHGGNNIDLDGRGGTSAAVLSGEESLAVPLAVGTTAVTLTVTAEDGTARSHRIDVVRQSLGAATTVAVSSESFTLTCPATADRDSEATCTLVNTSSSPAPWPVVAIIHSSADPGRALVAGDPIIPDTDPAYSKDVSLGTQQPQRQDFNYGYGELFSGGSRTVYRTYGYEKFDWTGHAAAGASRQVAIRLHAGDDSGTEVFYVAVAPSDYTGLSQLVDNKAPVLVSAAVKVLVITPNQTTRVYGDTTGEDLGFSVGGLDPGDAAADVVEGDKLARTAGDDAGTYTLSLGTLEIKTAFKDKYALPAAPAATVYTITEKPVTFSSTAADKVYDGTTAAPPDLAGSFSPALVGADVVTVTGGTYASKNVGDGIVISGATASGADASNYTVTVGDITGDITTAAVSATAVVTRAYDGTTNFAGATLAASTITGVVSGESLTLAVTGGTFASKDADTAIEVTSPAFSFTAGPSTAKSNYSLPASITVTGTITAKEITAIGGVTVETRDWDGTAAAASFDTSLATGTGVLAGELDNFRAGGLAASGAFPAASAGAAGAGSHRVSVTYGLADAGTGANKFFKDNYTIKTSAQTATLTGTVNAVAPSEPQNAAAAAADAAGKLEVSWAAPARTGGAAVSGYRVRWRTAEVGTQGQPGYAAAGAWQGASGDDDTGEDAGNNLKYTIENLTAGTLYDIAVAAVNTAGTGAFTTAVQATPAAPPPSVSGVSVGSVTQTSATATVTVANPDSGGTTLHLRHRPTASQGPWTTTSKAATTASVEFTLSGLTASTAYTVQASFDSGFAAGVATQTFTTAHPVVGFSASAYSGAEGGSVTVELSLSAAQARPVQFRVLPQFSSVAKWDSDYRLGECPWGDEEPCVGYLYAQIPAGDTSYSFEIGIEDDDLVEGDETFTLEIHLLSWGFRLGESSEAVVTIVDNDDPAVIVSETAVSVVEDRTIGTYTVRLASRPRDVVRVVAFSPNTWKVQVKPAHGRYHVPGSARAVIDFGSANWDQPQTFEVKGIYDHDGSDEEVVINHTVEARPDSGYAGTEAASVTVTVDDKHTPSVTVTKNALAPEVGATAGYGMYLSTDPSWIYTEQANGSYEPAGSHTVTIEATSSNPAVATVSPASVTFTASEGDYYMRSFTVTGVSAGTATITHTITGTDPAYTDPPLVVQNVNVTVTEPPAQQQTQEPDGQPAEAAAPAAIPAPDPRTIRWPPPLKLPSSSSGAGR